jgi:hypothetical protein
VTNPRFTTNDFQKNLSIAYEVAAIAADAGASADRHRVAARQG